MASGGSYLDTYLAFETGADGEGQGETLIIDLGQGESDDDGEYPVVNLAFLRRHAQSNNVSERQVAVRHIVKTLQHVTGDREAESAIFQFISSSSGQERDFASDQDPLIRAELVEQFPLICMHCYQSKSLYGKINEAIVPLLVKFLNDPNVQVRKTCQAAILILLEQSLFGSGETSTNVFQSEICPVLLRQVEPEGFSDDIRIEAVGLLCKIVTGAFNRAQAVEVFLAKYTALCSDQLFHIRKVCASALGDMSRLLGPELTERVLVPHLISLSQDSVWGVRKACADVFTEVSLNCCMATRRNNLAPVFIHLLSDASRWVQSSTFQALGPFISTFADSNRTGLKCINGELVYEEPKTVKDSNSSRRPETDVPHDVIVPAMTTPPRRRVDSDEDVMINLDGLLGDLPLASGDVNDEQAELSLGKRTEPDGAPDVNKEGEVTSCDSPTDVGKNSGAGSESSLSQDNFERQDMIPQDLLDNFLSMVEPSRAQTVESDIARHCAYNIPAVALTMGRQHWPLILPTYRLLAQDMQWKVRRTLAFSLHDLAAILGPEVAFRDLLPVFTNFLRDLDEVRVGVLKNLYQFLKLLDRGVRKELLQLLADFLQTDNVRNWRFRLLLAEQLIRLCEVTYLYDAEDINEYLSPIGMTLAIDKVADIRNQAHKLLATIMKHFFESERKRNGSTMALTNSFILDIIRGFGHSQRSKRRQSFAYICGEIMCLEAVSVEKFVSELLAPYLCLTDDPIPNVRISFVRSVSLDFFRNTRSWQQVFTLLKRMSSGDPDKDVVILSRQLLANLNIITITDQQQAPTEC